MQVVDKDGNVFGAGLEVTGPDGKPKTANTGGVSQIIAGSNITISPTEGTGVVTIDATGGGGSSTDAIVYAIALG